MHRDKPPRILCKVRHRIETLGDRRALELELDQLRIEQLTHQRSKARSLHCAGPVESPHWPLKAGISQALYPHFCATAPAGGGASADAEVMLNKENLRWAKLLHTGNSECNENFINLFYKENKKAS